MKRKRMSYAQYVRAQWEAVILMTAGFIAYQTTWWVLFAVFCLLWVRNYLVPLKPEEYDDGQ